LKVADITEPGSMGDFSLRSQQAPPLNAFVRLRDLSSKLGELNKVNLFVAGGSHMSEHFRFEKVPILLGIESWLWRRMPRFAETLGLGYSQRPLSGDNQKALAHENALVRSFASLDFLGITLRDLTNDHAAEVRSSQVFLE